jgi:hypothetical protein
LLPYFALTDFCSNSLAGVSRAISCDFTVQNRKLTAFGTYELNNFLLQQKKARCKLSDREIWALFVLLKNIFLHLPLKTEA